MGIWQWTDINTGHRTCRSGIRYSLRYDTRCYFNVRSKADMSRLNRRLSIFDRLSGRSPIYRYSWTAYWESVFESISQAHYELHASLCRRLSLPQRPHSTYRRHDAAWTDVNRRRWSQEDAATRCRRRHARRLAPGTEAAAAGETRGDVVLETAIRSVHDSAVIE